MASTNLTSVAALEGFVREFSSDLIRKSYYGNKTAAIATPHTGVKGKKVLNILQLGTMGRRWSKTFNPPAGTLTFVPRELVVEKAKFELQIDPQDFYDTYLGRFHNGTFNNTDTYPFEADIMNAVSAGKALEIENAWWRAVKAVSPQSTDTLMQVIDGWLTIIAKDQASGTPVLTPVVTPGGVLTENNILEVLEEMYDQLDPAYQDMPFGVFVSPKSFSMYNRRYRNDISKYTDNAQNGRVKLDFCDGELIRTPGMGTSQRMMMTPVENLHYGYDGIEDPSTFNFEKFERTIKYWSDFLFGVQFGLFQQGVIVINDLD